VEKIGRLLHHRMSIKCEIMYIRLFLHNFHPSNKFSVLATVILLQKISHARLKPCKSMITFQKHLCNKKYDHASNKMCMQQIPTSRRKSASHASILKMSTHICNQRRTFSGANLGRGPPAKLQSSYYSSVCCSPYANKTPCSQSHRRQNERHREARRILFLVQIEPFFPLFSFSPGLDGGTEALVEAGGECPVEFVSFALGAPFGRRRHPR
jgi:hypothetical protein